MLESWDHSTKNENNQKKIKNLLEIVDVILLSKSTNSKNLSFKKEIHCDKTNYKVIKSD